jgi:hypothetical protein
VLRGSVIFGGKLVNVGKILAYQVGTVEFEHVFSVAGGVAREVEASGGHGGVDNDYFCCA